MEQLPCEIAVNILSRLPFKSTARCRCVSKTWLSIISDSTFSSTQLTQLFKLWPDVFIHMICRGPRMFYLEDNEIIFNQTSLKPVKKLHSNNIPYTLSEYPIVLGLCNGYICISEDKIIDNCVLPVNPFHVFNPITEEYSKLPDFTLSNEGNVPDTYEEGKISGNWLSGFGFQESTRKFKLVVVVFSAVDYASQVFSNEVQVLTLGSNIWRRKIGIVPGVLVRVRAAETCSVVPVNNCLHWITTDRDSPNYGLIIVSFNLDVEEFGFVPIPEIKLLQNWLYHLRVLEEHLSVVECSPECYLQIWVMEEYMVKDSWVKKFSIQQDLVCPGGSSRESLELIKLCKNGEFLLRCNYRYLVLYNPTSGKYRFVRVEGVEGDHYYEAHPFVGSLTPLKLVCGVGSTSKET